ncbi:MAG: IreB family regulatory phosphoprotein [Oscillospiraceae bacterium]|jgi:uncharacterized protein (UPF0297 family)|nr:IreB family regulatory phosphoprotein [Oscillospiraceae bacterium]
MNDIDYTRKFSVSIDKDQEIRMILSSVYNSLQEKGYNPINQIVGYILSEDPTYITNHNNARTLIRQLDRDELLQVLLKSYLHEK